MATNETPKITEVKAFARYIHVSPRKLRLVADLVRRMPVDAALEQLRFSSKNAAIPLAKAINSAIANAVHNFNLNKENLFIKAVTIDGGPVFKRYAPRAQGRAFIERKRTSHINVVLESRERTKKTARSMFSLRPRTHTDARKVNQPESGEVDNNKTVPKQAGKSDEKMKQQKVSLKRRLFNRKSGQ
ncbi:MAG: 50S ribosomal protein L22 [Candidatus Doudnabacteria bacterium]|nr:50S ribosomal protein L22 [Candidatus Doudnabacteria bacterium]